MAFPESAPGPGTIHGIESVSFVVNSVSTKDATASVESFRRDTNTGPVLFIQIEL